MSQNLNPVIRDPRKYTQASCAKCSKPVHGKGWFCSYECDAAEAATRAARYKAKKAKVKGNA